MSSLEDDYIFQAIDALPTDRQQLHARFIDEALPHAHRIDWLSARIGKKINELRVFALEDAQPGERDPLGKLSDFLFIMEEEHEFTGLPEACTALGDALEYADQLRAKLESFRHQAEVICGITGDSPDDLCKELQQCDDDDESPAEEQARRERRMRKPTPHEKLYESYDPEADDL